MYEGTDHYVVLAKIKMKGRWEYGRKNGKGKVSKVLASERMDRKEFKEEYERKICERLTESMLTVEDGASVSEVYLVFKDVVTPIATEAIGNRPLRVHRKGNAWYRDEIKEAIQGKRRAYRRLWLEEKEK